MKQAVELDSLIELRCKLSTRNNRDVSTSDNIVEREVTGRGDPNESVGLDHDVVGFAMNLTVYTKNSRVVAVLSGDKFSLKGSLGKQVLGDFLDRIWGRSERAEQ